MSRETHGYLCGWLWGDLGVTLESARFHVYAGLVSYSLFWTIYMCTVYLELRGLGRIGFILYQYTYSSVLLKQSSRLQSKCLGSFPVSPLPI